MSLSSADEAVSIVIANYNGGDELLRTIDACRGSRCRVHEIIVADDGSTDGSPQAVVARYPDVRLELLPRNTAMLNVVRNAGLRAATGRYALLLDNDVALAPDTLPRLLDVIRQSPLNATASPRLQYSDRTHKVYWDGGLIHYLAVAVCQNRDVEEPPPPRPPERNLGCGNVLIDLEKLREIGYFDEDYRMGWGDDGEIYYRFVRAGYECLHVSDVSALHVAKTRTTERLPAQLFNRWLFMTKNYDLGTLLRIAPALLLFEALQFTFCVTRSSTRDYLRALGDYLQRLPGFVRDRRRILRTSVRRDTDVLIAGSIFVASDKTSALERRLLHVLDRLFRGYWWMVAPRSAAAQT